MIIPPGYEDLMEEPIVGILGSTMPNGNPHQAVVWRLWEPPYILVSTHAASQKFKNIQQNPAISLIMVDPRNDTRNLIVRGEVEKTEPDTDHAVLDRISLYYRGHIYYGGVAPLEDKRDDTMTLYIKPTKFIPVTVW